MGVAQRLKLVWEKVDLFNLIVRIKALPLPFPRKNDDWLILVLEHEGYTDNELIRLNRVRCHQHVVFYLDIFNARGRSLDRQYRIKQPDGDRWSSLIFPNEKPPGKDF